MSVRVVSVCAYSMLTAVVGDAAGCAPITQHLHRCLRLTWPAQQQQQWGDTRTECSVVTRLWSSVDPAPPPTRSK